MKTPTFDSSKPHGKICGHMENGATVVQNGAYFNGSGQFCGWETEAGHFAPVERATSAPDPKPDGDDQVAKQLAGGNENVDPAPEKSDKPKRIGVDLDGDGKVDVTVKVPKAKSA
jgi:hypothetical protein